jgi:hypothetical protein
MLQRIDCAERIEFQDTAKRGIGSMQARADVDDAAVHAKTVTLTPAVAKTHQLHRALAADVAACTSHGE